MCIENWQSHEILLNRIRSVNFREWNECGWAIRPCSFASGEDTAKLRHLGLWQQGVRVSPARAPPEVAERVIEPWLADPFPGYDTEPVMMYANG